MSYIDVILKELESAEEKHPDFPDDPIHIVSIMNEESGEAIRAALQYVYENKPIAEIRKELIQTAAMCIRGLRNLKNLPEYYPEDHKHGKEY